MNRPDDHLEQLLSLALDNELSADQRQALDRALAADPLLRAEMNRYERLSRLLAGWRVLDPATDLDSLNQRITATIRADNRRTGDTGIETASRGRERSGSPGSDDFDLLLRDAVGPVPEVDWARFAHEIAARVRHEHVARQAVPARWRSRAAWFARVAVPLAAAAVIALAMWWPRHETPAGKGGKRPSVFVSFDKSPPTGYVAPSPPSEGSGIAIGPPHQDLNELPIDPAMLP